jgi:hypothetical protein
LHTSLLLLPLLLLLRAGEGRDIELRHQRTPDVIFDCVRAVAGEPDMLPAARYISDCALSSLCFLSQPAACRRRVCYMSSLSTATGAAELPAAGMLRMLLLLLPGLFVAAALPCSGAVVGREWDVPAQVFTAIETMLPTGKGLFLELWAAAEAGRAGWTHIVEQQLQQQQQQQQ